MINLVNFFKEGWKIINKLHPETRTVIILLLSGWIFYSLIINETSRLMEERALKEQLYNKEAEKYSMESAIEINRQIQLIAEKDDNAFNVLLLNYHNNTLSLLGYKYLYLSCLTEAPKSLDAPTLKQLWNRIDYIYYADELAKIHSLSFVLFNDIELMANSLPKLYRLVKASDAKSISFFTIEGHDSQIGLVVILYKESKHYDYKYARGILPCILKLAILLDYNKIKK